MNNPNPTPILCAFYMNNKACCIGVDVTVYRGYFVKLSNTYLYNYIKRY